VLELERGESSAATGLAAAGASADITPIGNIQLAGYLGRESPFAGIASPLEANALALCTDGARVAVVLTLDTLFVGPIVEATLISHFVNRHGQNANDLLVLASHTHFAPSIDETKPLLGRVDADYVALVIDRCKALMDSVISSLGTGASIRRHAGSSLAAINRRRWWPLPHVAGGRRIAGPEACMAPNPAGPLDPAITAWIVTGQAGRPVAAIWHYACHPTGFCEPLKVSAEFPGVVRERLRHRFGNIPVLFLQGFAGDIRPRVPESRPASTVAWRTLLWGPSFSGFTLPAWRQWANSLADEVAATFDEPPVPDELTASARIESAEYDLPLSRLVTDDDPKRVVRFQRLRVSPALDIVAVGAEPLTDLRRHICFPGTIAVGYLGDVFGYWPTDTDAREGGYEVGGFLRAFGLQGRLRHPLDGEFTAAIDQLALP